MDQDRFEKHSGDKQNIGQMTHHTGEFTAPAFVFIKGPGGGVVNILIGFSHKIIYFAKSIRNFKVIEIFFISFDGFFRKSA